MSPAMRQAAFWNIGGLVWWRIYASLGLNELTKIFWRFFFWIGSSAVGESDAKFEHIS